MKRTGGAVGLYPQNSNPSWTTDLQFYLSHVPQLTVDEHTQFASASLNLA